MGLSLKVGYDGLIPQPFHFIIHKIILSFDTIHKVSFIVFLSTAAVLGYPEEGWLYVRRQNCCVQRHDKMDTVL
jgi:hypothetical protein